MPSTFLLKISVSIVSAALCLAVPIYGEVHQEVPGTLSVVISPEHYSHENDGLDKLRGTFYNASAILSPTGSKIYLFVQGGMFEARHSPWPWCSGDNIVLFEAPNTPSGYRSQFQPVRRVSPCNPNVFHAYGLGSVFRGSDGVYRILIDEHDGGDNFPNAARVLMGTSTDGVNWSFPTNINPFIKRSTSGLGLGDITLVQDVSNSSLWWGTFKWGTDYPGNVGRIRVVKQASNPRGFVVYLRSGGTWRAVNNDGSFSFVPDNVWSADLPSPSSLIRDDGRWELWSDVEPQGETVGCDDNAPGAGSWFVARSATLTTLGGYEGVHSYVRALPSQNDTGRMLPARINGVNGEKLLYSASTDRVCSDPVTRDNWLYGWSHFRGSEIVVTVVNY